MSSAKNAVCENAVCCVVSSARYDTCVGEVHSMVVPSVQEPVLQGSPGSSTGKTFLKFLN